MPRYEGSGEPLKVLELGVNEDEKTAPGSTPLLITFFLHRAPTPSQTSSPRIHAVHGHVGCTFSNGKTGLWLGAAVVLGRA